MHLVKLNYHDTKQYYFRKVERMLQSYTEYVKRYGIAELVFRGPSEEIRSRSGVKGTMAGQAGKHAEGFYDETAYAKLRFMPSCEGTYEITAVTSWAMRRR